jgi:hypothetical protein
MRKSGGYQIHTSQLAMRRALEHLILILVITTLHLTSLGVGVVHAEQRRFVDPDWERRVSYLKLGRRWRRQQDQRGWQSFAPLRAGSCARPLPNCRPCARAVFGGSNGVDLPIAV